MHAIKSPNFLPYPRRFCANTIAEDLRLITGKSYFYRAGSPRQRTRDDSLYLLPSLPQLAGLGSKNNAQDLSNIWPWIEPLTAFCSARALGGWRDIKSAL